MIKGSDGNVHVDSVTLENDDDNDADSSSVIVWTKAIVTLCTNHPKVVASCVLIHFLRAQVSIKTLNGHNITVNPVFFYLSGQIKEKLCKSALNSPMLTQYLNVLLGLHKRYNSVQMFESFQNLNPHFFGTISLRWFVMKFIF